jgi:exosortase/archaeosortase family protein
LKSTHPPVSNAATHAADLRFIAALLFCYLCAIVWDHSGWWLLDEEYRFGFLIPCFSAYVIFERWPRIRNILSGEGSPGAPVRQGRCSEAIAWICEALLMGMSLSAMGLFVMGALIRLAEGGRSVPSSLIFAAGFTLLLLSLPPLLLRKDPQGRTIPVNRRLELIPQLLFPATIWLLSSPPPGFVKQEIKLFLLNKVVTVVHGLFELFGHPLILEGNTFLLPEGRVGVADACSGIRSLTGCLVTGAFIAAVSCKSWPSRIFILTASILLAVLGNLARSLFLTIHAYLHGPQAIEGWVHDASGYAVLVVTAIGLWLLTLLLGLADRDWSTYLKDIPQEKDDSR